MTLIGIISDTHNLLRLEAINALKGSEIIIHAGDIGNSEIIDRLKIIAPVFAVRGNIDKSAWGDTLPISDVIEISGKFIYLLHNIHEIDLDPVAAGFDAVISGHSHKPKIENKNGVFFINPGSAGPRRFSLPVTVAILQIVGKNISCDLIELRV
ncbi:metallophosphoesterase family protein [Desulfobacula sp.]|uniref:metallophosphoesterase family protein n=1 Tax=Desulfobacula sp. TaxID=2593537 RepID=UPI00260EAC4A|nr:metallophosphoesterase family protein [Desulfobacula sp.]